ncbi:hypothetical protein IW262DRAFT_1272129 [Armillaria fumosa]|nr:hypothetical protein IW262DRAFT_1272129 [Armillaria fumosa]
MGRAELPCRQTKESEQHVILCEANTILWATTIHDMSVNMVASKAPSLRDPPGPILTLSFVEAAIILNMKLESVKASNFQGFTALVEWKLPTHKFTKYISNSSPLPIPGLDVDAHAKALFLCFLQHVQFHYLFRKVFVSDYQGKISLTTY